MRILILQDLEFTISPFLQQDLLGNLFFPQQHFSLALEIPR